MEQQELNYFVQILQKRISEYFNQSLMFEAKFEYQNAIISQLKEKLEEVTRSNEEYVAQIEHMDAKMKGTATTSRRKKSTAPSDGGEF